MGKRARQASPLSAACSQGIAVARGADPQAMVRRSRIAPCVTCGLCGGFLRDAAVIPECLHSCHRYESEVKYQVYWLFLSLDCRAFYFTLCRQCIVEEFTDNNINRCPKCNIDWGCNPLKKLRPDHSLQHVRSVIFPVKRHKVGKISPRHPAFVSLPSPSNQAHGIDHSAKKADAHLMPEPMNSETETEADERLGKEPSPYLEEVIASSPNTVVAPGAEPAWPDDSQNRQRDQHREEASSALGENELNVEELREAIEGSRIELCAPIPKHAVQFQEFESEHHGLLDKQATPQESDKLDDEVDPWTVAVEKLATESTVSAQGWSKKGWTTAMAACTPLSTRPDPWTIVVENMTTESTISTRGWSEEGWTTTMAACALPSTRPDPWTITVEKMATESTVSAQGWSEEGWTGIRPDSWTVAVEKLATDSTVSAQGWSKKGWTAAMAARAPRKIRPDPWTIAVEKMATEPTVSAQGWPEEGWTSIRPDSWTVAVEKLATDSTVSAQGWSKKGWTAAMAARAPRKIRPDPWTIAVEKMATESTVSAQGWSEEGWTTAMAACALPSTRPDPWTVVVEKMATESTVSAQGWSEEGWTTAMAACDPPSARPDPWTIAVEKMATKSTVSAQGWSKEGWTTAMAARAPRSTRLDPWTIAVEKMATEPTVSARGWSEEGWTTAMATCAPRSTRPDPWTIAVEKMATESTVCAQGWSEEGWTTELAACAPSSIRPDPWTIAVEKMATQSASTVSTQKWSEEGWATAMAACAPRNISPHDAFGSLRAAEQANAAAAAKDADEARKEADKARAERDRVSALTAQVQALTDVLQAERARAQVLEDQVGRLRRELEAARASEAEARRQVADERRDAESAAEVMRCSFNRARDRLEEFGLHPGDLPDRTSVAGYALGFARVADGVDRLRDAIAERFVEDVRTAVAETAEFVLACCLSRDASFRLEAVLEGVVAADDAAEDMLRCRARETAWKVANEMVVFLDEDAPPRAGDNAACIGGNS